MAGVTKEQIAKAKEWDLLSYLQAYEPQELKKSGPREYCTRTHDSLKISNGKWCWNSRGIGGRTALDYLIKVRGMDFVGAVETLCGYSAPPPVKQTFTKPTKPQKPFKLPEASRCASAVVGYLQDRSIDPELLGVCMEAGILYESRRYQNCVFVGRDMQGNARAASLRGTRDGFRMDVEGSDKRYSFCLPASRPDCPRLAVAESPIDALSVATLLKLQGEDFGRNHYLSLGGTAPRALLRFLRDHEAVTHISLCLDNDRAGILGIEKIREAVREDATLSRRIQVIADNPPAAGGKDYNELLCQRAAALRPASRYEERA